MSGEVIGLIMAGLLLLGLFMGHPLAFVLGGTAVLGALIAGKPMVLGIVINRIFGEVLDNYILIAIPLFVQTVFIFTIAYLAARLMQLRYADAAPAAMIGA